MPKTSHVTNILPATLGGLIAKPVWDSACAYRQAQVEYDRLTRELDRAATVLLAANENLSAALKNHGIGSVVIDMNATDRLVTVFNESRGQHSFLLLKQLTSAVNND